MDLLLRLFPFLAIVAMAVLVLGLFYGINRRVHQLRKQIAQCEASISSRSLEFANGLQELKRSMAEWGTDQESDGRVHAARAAGLNNSLRGKVLKMHRLGQTPDRIAEALRVPKGEVDLLVKVHRIVMRPYEEVPAAEIQKLG